MIKIDFHIHTVSTSKDAQFTFSLDTLENYIKEKKIDAIAITNHNVFDINNYEAIRNRLTIDVFPGIEIDLETGHILVIANPINLISFEKQAKAIQEEYFRKGNISIDFFEKVFTQTNGLIMIPHYEKKPKVPKQILNLLGENIFCGEVSNPNKFYRLFKKENDLTPVLFSDFRASTDDKGFPNSQTFLDIESKEFSIIKECLKDKNKVFLNNKKSRDLFPLLEDGTLASTGLNVIIGKRSTGKTYTMDYIFNSDKFRKVKYIRQFELIEKEQNSAEREFKTVISNRQSNFTDSYLNSFKQLVVSYGEIDLNNYFNSCKDYVSSLVSYAIESDKLDSFARVPLFKEQEFLIPDIKGLTDVIDAVIVLLKNETVKSVIEKHIKRENLVSLLSDLIQTYISQEKLRKKYERTNLIIRSVKERLKVKSSLNPISTFDCVAYSREKIEAIYFSNLVNGMKKTKIICEEPIGKFAIQAKRKPISSCSTLQKIFKSKVGFKDAFNSYDFPCTYYEKLNELSQIPSGDIYKGFFEIEYSILNENGFPVSGGQRAEFNLEQKLADAENYDMLLIDEPESSFDNLFLKHEIDAKIKELSTKMPVFVSTHNNVVGASIKPDYILYTEAKCIDGKTQFSVYSGYAGAKKLCSQDGSAIENYQLTMNCLEGGEDAYNERSETYETIKN